MEGKFGSIKGNKESIGIFEPFFSEIKPLGVQYIDPSKNRSPNGCKTSDKYFSFFYRNLRVLVKGPGFV